MESAFVDAVGVAIREISNSPVDSERRVAGKKAFLVIPWLLLLRPADHDTTDDSCASLLSERLDRFWQGDVEGLFRECMSLAVPRIYFSRQRDQSDTATAARVKTLARAGEDSRALKAVSETTEVSVTADAVREIKKLFPTAPLHDEFGDDDVHTLDGFDNIDRDALVTELRKTLIRLPRLSGAGPLCMRNEHLSLIAKSTECGENLASILADLGLGRAPASVMSFFVEAGFVHCPRLMVAFGH